MDRILTWFSKCSPISLLILAVVVGLGGACGAALFHAQIYLSTAMFFGHDGTQSFITVVEAIPVWKRILIPTFGGLLIGIIFALTKVSEAEGEGVPEVMEALAHKKGTIRPIVAPIKIITAALTLGSGGSAGREGPVIQIGSAIGSAIAQYTRQPAAKRGLLLAAGAAAGIGGTFGAPIAGVLFTIEILKHRSSGYLNAAVLVIAAFVGTYGARLLIEGHSGLRFISDATFSYSLKHILAFICLSIISALIALFFGKILGFSRYVFSKVSVPHFLKPAIGGFFIGIIGLYMPLIHEPAAYPLMIDLIAISSLPILLLFILLILKMTATGITLGSGGSGGIFAPLLLIGAITGSIFASALIFFNLSTVALTPLFVIFAMAAVFAGAAHAPLTAAFITYEMTENISYLLPLLIICFITSLMAKRLNPQSIYHTHTN